MSSVRRVAKNAAFLYSAHIITNLLALALSIFIARTLGDIAFGKYAFATALISIFAIFVELGFTALIIRDVSQDNTLVLKYRGNITLIKVILSIVIYGIIAITINVMDCPPDTTIVVLILSVHMILTSLADICRGVFRAFERMEYQALVLIICRIVIFTWGFSALLLGYSLVEVVYAYIVSGILDLLMSSLICSKKFVRLKLEMDLELWKKLVKAALPITFMSVAVVIYVRIDTIMLSAMKGDAVVGWYNAAYNLTINLHPIAMIFGAALTPLMSRLYTTSMTSLGFVYGKAFKYLFILGLPLTVGTMLLSEQIILLLYDTSFNHSITALRILAWDILLMFLCSFLGRVLFYMHRQNHVAAIAGICAVINIILNLILIPYFSYIGAGIATIITEAILFGLYYYFISKFLTRLPLHRIMVKPIFACSIMATIVYFGSMLNLAVLIITAILIYFAVLLLIKGFTKEDRELIAELIPRWRR